MSFISEIVPDYNDNYDSDEIVSDEDESVSEANNIPTRQVTPIREEQPPSRLSSYSFPPSSSYPSVVTGWSRSSTHEPIPHVLSTTPAREEQLPSLSPFPARRSQPSTPLLTQQIQQTSSSIPIRQLQQLPPIRQTQQLPPRQSARTSQQPIRELAPPPLPLENELHAGLLRGVVTPILELPRTVVPPPPTYQPVPVSASQLTLSPPNHILPSSQIQTPIREQQHTTTNNVTTNNTTNNTTYHVVSNAPNSSTGGVIRDEGDQDNRSNNTGALDKGKSKDKEEKDKEEKDKVRQAQDLLVSGYLRFIEDRTATIRAMNNYNKYRRTFGIEHWFDCRRLDKNEQYLDDLLNIAQLVEHLKYGADYVVKCYKDNYCIMIVDANISKISEAYSFAPEFVKLVSNDDIEQLVTKFDDLTDQQIIDDPGLYKIEYFTTKLTDQQLTRLMVINKQHKMGMIYNVITKYDQRYESIAADGVYFGDDYFEYDYIKLPFRTYILEHDKVPDDVLFYWLHEMSEIDIKFYSKHCLFQILCASEENILHSTDDFYPTKVVKYIQSITTDTIGYDSNKVTYDGYEEDVKFIRKHRLWKLFNYFPCYTYELAKRFDGESIMDFHMKLNTILPSTICYGDRSTNTNNNSVNNSNNRLVPITGDNNICYVTQEPIYRCQLYHTCNNNHCVSQDGYEGMVSANKDKPNIYKYGMYHIPCGMCRCTIFGIHYVNMSTEDCELLFSSQPESSNQ